MCKAPPYFSNAIQVVCITLAIYNHIPPDTPTLSHWTPTRGPEQAESRSEAHPCETATAFQTLRPNNITYNVNYCHFVLMLDL